MKSVLELRKLRNMSQIELCQRAGCSPTTLLRIEKFGHKPQGDCPQRIATALGVNVTEIWPMEAGQ